ncbi:type I secretion protein [Shimia sediminis]|uniref:type I secretion protein n=1 Tax=Shimia sediminis TaxID=2497945 RepID=UPI0013E00F47|nr:type I secretion protein [Shimia sediminis]
MAQHVSYKLEALKVDDTVISVDLFGGNILISRDEVGVDGRYDELAEELGVNGIRFPGGAVTEMYFDINDPDATETIHPENGTTIELMPYSTFMEFAQTSNHPVNIVLPTISLLSEETDSNGHRYTNINEDDFRTFIHDTLEGDYGLPNIAAFEIGNEYWGSGQMTSVEYGRVASELSVIVKDEIMLAALDNPELAEIDVLVQMGYNYNFARLTDNYDHLESNSEILAALSEDYGIDFDENQYTYGSGDIKWPYIANELIQAEFDTNEEIEAMDGIVAHLYSKEPVIEGSRGRDLSVIEQTWRDDNPELEIHITEWNQKASTNAFDRTEDYGLKQAHEILNIMDEMISHDVAAAYVWPLLQNTKNALSFGHEHDELSVSGEMFKMMSETMPGKRTVEFRPIGSDEEPASHVHAYYGDNELVFFVASNTDETSTTEIDLESLVSDYGSIEAQVIGVVEGEPPGDTRSEAEVEELDEADVYEENFLIADLDAYEILHVVFRDVELTPEMAELLEDEEIEVDEGEIDPDDEDDVFPPDYGLPPEVEEEEEEEEDDSDSIDDGGGLDALGYLLPFLLLLAAFGIG